MWEFGVELRWGLERTTPASKSGDDLRLKPDITGNMRIQITWELDICKRMMREHLWIRATVNVTTWGVFLEGVRVVFTVVLPPELIWRLFGLRGVVRRGAVSDCRAFTHSPGVHVLDWGGIALGHQFHAQFVPISRVLLRSVGRRDYRLSMFITASTEWVCGAPRSRGATADHRPDQEHSGSTWEVKF